MKSYITAAKSDISLIVKNNNPPMVKNLGVKKLNLSEDEDDSLMIKFSHKPRYENAFGRRMVPKG